MRRLLLPAIILSLLPLLTSCSGGSAEFSWYGLTVDDGVAYLAANQQVFALDLEGGAKLWAFPPEPDDKIGPFYATPVVLDDLIIVGDAREGKLYGLERASGVERWMVETESRIVDGITRFGDDVVAGDGQGNIYVVAADGSSRVTDAASNPWPLFSAQKGIWAPPLADPERGIIYLVSLDHHVYALDMQEGDLVWDFEAEGSLVGTPALSNGLLYVGSFDRKLYAIDVQTGRASWHFEASNWIWGSPLVQGGVVYFGDLDGYVYVRNAQSGAEVWTFEAEGEIRATPLLADGVLYVGTGAKNVYALEAETGTQLWKQATDGPIYSQIHLQDGLLLVSPLKAKVKLIALDPEGGAQRWAFPSEDQ